MIPIDELIEWRGIFARWLRHHTVLDRIDFADVPRFTGQFFEFDQTGPIVTITRTPE